MPRLFATGVFRPSPNLARYAESVIGPAVKAAGDESAQLLQDTSKGYAPVDTGALRDSIGVTYAEDGFVLTWRIGPSMFYALFVEYGTGQRGDPSSPFGHVASWKGQFPQPYQRPALDECRAQVLQIFRTTIAAAI